MINQVRPNAFQPGFAVPNLCPHTCHAITVDYGEYDQTDWAYDQSEGGYDQIDGTYDQSEGGYDHTETEYPELDASAESFELQEEVIAVVLADYK